MNFEYFTKGVVIGISIAAPVGPIGILCIRRSINDGWVKGMVSGLGAACADMIYGAIAAFGVGAILTFLLDQQEWIRGIGSLFLIILGSRIVFSNPSTTVKIRSREGLFGAFLSTFILTLTNPLTILSFGAMFAGFGLLNNGDSNSASTMIVMGVFVGSSIWWLFLTGFVSRLRTRFNASVHKWINRASGSIIMVFGFSMFLGLFVV
jgi:threonine/homoserine/homoserine lactone efflux protein